jgi:hypothetical protein
LVGRARGEAVVVRRRDVMADVTCPLHREERDALLSDIALPSDIRMLLEDPARTVELAHGYELDWPEMEARSLLAHAASHDMRVAVALREELAGCEKRKREGGR